MSKYKILTGITVNWREKRLPQDAAKFQFGKASGFQRFVVRNGIHGGLPAG